MYPGLKSHHKNSLMSDIMNEKYGYSGILAIDVIDERLAESLMKNMQQKNIGFLAVSLNYLKLYLICQAIVLLLGSDEEQIEMGLSKGIIRLSVGIDDNIDFI